MAVLLGRACEWLVTLRRWCHSTSKCHQLSGACRQLRMLAICAGSATGEARNRRSSAVSLPEGWDAATAAHRPRPRASSMSPTAHDMAPSNVCNSPCAACVIAVHIKLACCHYWHASPCTLAHVQSSARKYIALVQRQRRTSHAAHLHVQASSRLETLQRLLLSKRRITTGT